MNIMSVLNQIMNQAGTVQSNQSQQTTGSSGGGIDMKSLVGGGALGLLLGSKRGRKMGKKAFKYGAVAGVGALAWKAYQNYQSNSQQAAAPAPVDKMSGRPPRIVEISVIIMGRKRIVAACSIASRTVSPRSRSWFANSTKRTEFFASSPMSITRPICE
jgi:uncharacterized membrane protein YebE (DUF533 family)